MNKRKITLALLISTFSLFNTTNAFQSSKSSNSKSDAQFGITFLDVPKKNKTFDDQFPMSSLDKNPISQGEFDIMVSLTNLNISDANIPCKAYYHYSALKEVKIGYAKKIAKNTFRCCGSLETVHMNSATKIGKAAFRSCYSLQNIYMDSVKKIGAHAFSDSLSLTQVNLPTSLIEIGEEAFSDCSLLEKVVIPSSVKKIDCRAFYCCCSLQEINIPSSIEQIGRGIFDYCKLQNLYLSRKFDNENLSEILDFIGIKNNENNPIRIIWID